jgi:hypothetical protein
MHLHGIHAQHVWPTSTVAALIQLAGIEILQPGEVMVVVSQSAEFSSSQSGYIN